MANYPSYPKKDFAPSQNFLARDPAGSGGVIRVQGQSMLDYMINDLKNRGKLVQAIDTFTEALATNYGSGTYVLVGGGSVVLDGSQAIYRVSDAGSGGTVMANGNELVLLFQANTGDAGDYDVGTDPDQIPLNQNLYVDSIANLPEVVEGQQLKTAGYHPSSTIGGGDFVGVASAVHDGVIYFDPLRKAEIGTAAYKVPQAPAPCWERIYSPRDEIDNTWAGEPDNYLARDVANLISPISSVANTSNQVLLEKLRTDYLEFCVYTPLSPDGREWHRWLFTNRFNVTNDGAPRMINCSLSGLYPTDAVAKVGENKTTETTASPTTATYASASGVTTGTWVGPASVLGVTDVIYSATVGDTIDFTVTGLERLVLRGLYAGNGGVGNVKVYTDAGFTTEISDANYLLQSDRIVSFIKGSQGVFHQPIAENLNSATTYYVRITVDATNPVGNRVYTAGILGYDSVVFDAIGIHGVVDDAALADQTNSRSYNPGTEVVYQFDNATRVDWNYVETNVASIAQFEVYDSTGAEVSAYENQTIDMYGAGSTAKKVTVAKGLAKGTYYLHVINGKTKNVSSTDYRYYDFGGFGYDETQAGVIGVDEFDDKDMPKNVTDPNNDTGAGTQYMLIGSGNLELAIDVEKPGSGVNEFVGGIHGHETTPVPVVSIGGAVVDFAGAAQFDTFIGSGCEIDFTTTLKFPSDLSDFATADYGLYFSQYGYTVRTKKTLLADALIYDDFSIMMNCPNTDTSQGAAQTQGLAVGGGFKYVVADKNYTIDSFDNAGTFILPHQKSVAFVNTEYTVLCNYTDIITPLEVTAPPFISSSYWSLIQDRTDRTVKFYTRAYPNNNTSGASASTGLEIEHAKNYRVIKGNYLGAFK